MATERQTKKLETIIRLATELLAEARGGTAAPATQEKRKRRAGKELVAFRKMLKAERKKGVSAAELAKLHGVSTAYIYSL